MPKSLVTISGSGPSCEGYGPVTIATKKRSLPSEYLLCRFPSQYYKAKGPQIPMMLYFNRCVCEPPKTCPICDGSKVKILPLNHKMWDEHWKGFIRKKQLSTHTKPSLGTCAVFAAVEILKAEEVGLIGMDNILDQDESWMHDPVAELRCIESLVNIVDLRSRVRA